MAIVISFALFIVIEYFNAPYIMPLLHKWNASTVIIVMVTTLINVFALAFVLMPLIVPACHVWIFAPWKESTNCLIALCQRGFTCFDAVGQRMRK